MALVTVPESVVTLSQRADWFHLQAGVASQRLQMLAKLQDFPGDWADFLFLISDDLERQMEAFVPAILELRKLEGGDGGGTFVQTCDDAAGGAA